MRAVNLIPADQRSGSTGMAGRSGGGAFIVLGLLAGIAILVFLYGSARHQISSKEAEAANISAQALSAEAQAAKLAPYTSFTSLHDERVKEIAQLVGTRFDWAHVFHEVGRVLPTNVSLSSIQGSIGSGSSSGSSAAAASTGSATSATPAGSVPTMTITGCTVSQSAVAVALGRLRLIDGVSEVQLESSAKSGSGSSSSSSSSAGSAGSMCGENAPTFTTQVTFTALPSPPTTSSTAGSPTTTAPDSTSSITPQPSTTTPAGATTTSTTSPSTTTPAAATPTASTSTASSGAD